MAQVTVELRHLIEQTDFELFDFDYPVTDPNFKEKIEEDVTEYFYSYEIGFETPDMFKQKFRAKFRRIMSYYNDLYNTTLLEYNPLINYKMSELMEQLTNTGHSEDSTQDLTSNTQTEDEGTRTEDTQTSSDNTRTDNLQTTTDSTRTDNLTRTIDETNTVSDYPQQPIAGGSYASGSGMRNSTEDNTGTVSDEGTTNQTGTVSDEGTTSQTGTVSDEGTTSQTGTVSDTGTGTTNRTDNTTANRTGTSTVNLDYEKTIEGLTGTSYQDLIAKERENILRISGMVIAELKTLFILVYQEV